MALVEYAILQLQTRLNNSSYSPEALQAAEGILRRINRPRYAVGDGNLRSEEVEYIEPEFQDEQGYESALNSVFAGAMVFQPLTIDNGEDSLFLDGAVFGVSFEKINVKTPIRGRQGGTVKELIGNGDYQISVTGLFTRRMGEYPFEEVETLNRIWRAQRTVDVTNELLNRLGIMTCIIDGSPSLPNGQFTNVQEYQFNMVSDEPPELKLR